MGLCLGASQDEMSQIKELWIQPLITDVHFKGMVELACGERSWFILVLSFAEVSD